MARRPKKDAVPLAEGASNICTTVAEPDAATHWIDVQDERRTLCGRKPLQIVFHSLLTVKCRVCMLVRTKRDG